MDASRPAVARSDSLNRALNGTRCILAGGFQSQRVRGHPLGQHGCYEIFPRQAQRLNPQRTKLI